MSVRSLEFLGPWSEFDREIFFIRGNDHGQEEVNKASGLASQKAWTLWEIVLNSVLSHCVNFMFSISFLFFVGIKHMSIPD